jgi:hypothetical protein
VGEDEPRANYFLAPGVAGGRILFDLGSAQELKQINTYSWHPGLRGPQVYSLFGHQENASSNELRDKSLEELIAMGWQKLADVQTRPKSDEPGGQYGVSISDPSRAMGPFRYLLFDLKPGIATDNFGNTFFSEMDVIDTTTAPEPITAGVEGGREMLDIDGKWQITIDTTETPDLREWTSKELAPVVREWYPKLVAMLPSEGYEAPRHVNIFFSKDMRGVAAAGGNRIRCAAEWFRKNLDGEGKGAVVHELVHVVQNYGWGRRNNPDAARTPGWIVEGIPDYIRWFLYEPQTKGAEITARNLERAKFDANYRISGNFLNWVVQKHGHDIIRKINAAARAGKYNEELWVELTGKKVEQLGDEWKKEHEERLAKAK